MKVIVIILVNDNKNDYDDGSKKKFYIDDNDIKNNNACSDNKQLLNFDANANSNEHEFNDMKLFHIDIITNYIDNNLMLIY